MKKRKSFVPAKPKLYKMRLNRLIKLISLHAPDPLIAAQLMMLLEALHGSYFAVLRLALREWWKHFWYERVERPYMELRCKFWCWRTGGSREAFFDLQELNYERSQPEAERIVASDDDVRH